MGLSNLFHKNEEQNNVPVQKGQLKALSGDSSVSEWLAHPVGGVIFRKMLADAGQKESVLRPVKRLAFKKLVSMSQGRFTEQMMNDIIAKANSGVLPEGATAVAPAESTEEEIVLPEWEEKISPNRFEGKTVIVTGAGSGIGQATASRVAREGGKVVAVDVSQERLDEFKASLPEQNIVTLTGDITKQDDIQKIVDAAGGQIDALANVAGIMDNMAPVHEVTDEVWDRVINVNLTGMMKLSRAAIPFMLERNRGTIVNVGSEASLKGSAAGAAYTASKHAVIGLTKNTAFMYGPQGIRVNAVAPGAVLTNIQARFDSKIGEDRVNLILSTIPDAATAEQLAASITYLLSDDSVNVNGAVVASDGGWSTQ